MKNLLNNLKLKLFKHTREQDEAIQITYNQMQNAYDLMIAIARLSLIKPDVLVRESKNIKSNAEYLVKMVEEQKILQNDKKE